MGEAASRHQRASGKNSSPRTRTLDALSEHRHLVVAAGVLLMLLAGWCGWRQVGSNSTRVADDEFAELAGFDDAVAPTLGDAADAGPLIVPAPLAEIEPPQWDHTALPPLPASSAEERSVVSFATSQELSPPASTAATPVWFVGTIESVDDTIELPAWTPEQPVQRYTRGMQTGEATVIR